MVNIANKGRVSIECEVFGEFQHLIPVHLMEDGGELGFSRLRACLVPNFKLQLQSPEGLQHCQKFIYAGVTRFPVGRVEKQVGGGARELPGEYRRALERLDRLYHGMLAKLVQPCIPPIVGRICPILMYKLDLQMFFNHWQYIQYKYIYDTTAQYGWCQTVRANVICIMEQDQVHLACRTQFGDL